MRKINKAKVALIIIIFILIFFVVYEIIVNRKNDDIGNPDGWLDTTNKILNETNNNEVNEITNRENNIVNNEVSDKSDDKNIVDNKNNTNSGNSANNSEQNSNNQGDTKDEQSNSSKDTQNDSTSGNLNTGSNGSSGGNTQSNNSKFDSSVAFIGDSRTQGFIMYNGLKNVQDYSYIGLMVDTAVKKEFIKTSNGSKITLLQDMKNKNIKKVYIMLGVNELGWSYPQVFKVKYEELIDEIRKVKPDCQIYVQSIIPVTKSKDKSDKIYNNKNIAKFNKLIKEVASEKNVKYLDVASVLVDSEGYLPEEASTDGVHVNKKYCEKWLNYLKNN